ncbi:MAG: M20 family metallopeptidase [Aquificae bacterium]|nr:M20 family metallopeptidase [Aquificota bacterium]
MELTLRVKDLLKELIGIKSVSGQERNIQEFIEKRLSSYGLKPVRQRIDGDRYNLFFLTDSPYVISCHVDTVPPIGMKNPYVPVEKNGRIIGRGASDVKGALASLITAVEVFLEGGNKLPLSLAFVIDEETNDALGSEKAPEILGEGKKCLVLEPTYGALCVAQEGALEFSVKVEGEGAHASEFEKTENPIKTCFQLIENIERRLSRPVNVIMIKGGSKAYLVPKRCEALLEIKVKEGESWKELEEKILQLIKELDTRCKVEYVREDAEDFISFRKDGFVNLLEETFLEAVGDKPKRGVMPSWTDAANYHKAGYECVVFGYGSLKDSHTDRESISVEDLKKMTLFFLKLLEKLK